MNTQRIAGGLVMTGLLAAAAPGIALGDDVECPANLGAVTVDGNVLVVGPCTLEGTLVIGNVHVYPGGTLTAFRASIDGSIQAEGAIDVLVDESRVNGNIQLDNLVGDQSTITRSVVGGSIQMVSNLSTLVVDDNDVNADVQAFGNAGGVDITNNVIDGNLQCKSNSPAPTGGFNQVQGNKEDQCANLQLAPPAGSSGGVNDFGAGEFAGGGGGGGAFGPELLLLAAGLLLLRGRRQTG